MEILHESIYDHPKYYDVVFGADCAAEVKFLLACGEAFLERSPERMFEPACGTGRLLFALAKRGHTVAGVDLNAKSVAYCNARFRRHGWDEPARVADMGAFDPGELSLGPPYDLAFNTINSFRHIGSERAARAHLECIGRVVRPGGLYLLGVHLTPTAAAPSETESWSARRGHLGIATHMWTIERDPKQRVERFGIRFDVRTPTRSFRICDELVLRSYTPAQMNQLIRSSGCWQTVATFDFGYQIDQPIEVAAATEDGVYVLRRR